MHRLDSKTVLVPGQAPASAERPRTSSPAREPPSCYWTPGTRTRRNRHRARRIEQVGASYLWARHPATAGGNVHHVHAVSSRVPCLPRLAAKPHETVLLLHVLLHA
jgi:hypothetical protein